jgi:hypothetical protein
MDDLDGLAADLHAGLDAAVEEAWSSLDQPPEEPAPEGPMLDPADEAAGWRIKDRKDDRAADGPAAITDDLERAFDKHAVADADADAASTWQRELRRLADQTLAAHGLDPANRHEAGISRRETVRRLFAAEQHLREAPAVALAHLARNYAAGSDGVRAAVAGEVMRALGFDTPGRIGEAERARLQHYEARELQAQREYAALLPPMAEKLERFKTEHAANFEQVRPIMHGLFQAAILEGRLLSLEDAYAQACRAQGVPTAQVAAAQLRQRNGGQRSRQRTARALHDPAARPPARRVRPMAP